MAPGQDGAGDRPAAPSPQAGCLKVVSSEAGAGGGLAG